MTDQEYEQKKRECWDEFCKSNGLYDQVHVLVPTAFYYAFDRAYALSREKETISQEDIQKAADNYAESAYYPAPDCGWYESDDRQMKDVLSDTFKAGANFALGKQEKDAEKTLSLEEEIHTYAKICSFTEADYTAIRKAVEYGISLAKSNAEDTVIQGWVCRDKKDDALNLHAEEPYRTQSGYQIGDKPDWWESDCASFLPLDKNLFPDLTWDDDPIEVEIVIKRKKK